MLQSNDGAGRQDDTMAWEEERRESKYAAGLVQLPAERKVSPAPEDWQCDFTGVTDNLWLNLSDGTIGSGRRHWDGSGGNGAPAHMLMHVGATAGARCKRSPWRAMVHPRTVDACSCTLLCDMQAPASVSACHIFSVLHACFCRAAPVP